MFWVTGGSPSVAARAGPAAPRMVADRTAAMSTIDRVPALNRLPGWLLVAISRIFENAIALTTRHWDRLPGWHYGLVNPCPKGRCPAIAGCPNG